MPVVPPYRPANLLTNRNITFMTWNLLHLAWMLKDNGGFPAYGNQRKEWDAGTRFGTVSGPTERRS